MEQLCLSNVAKKYNMHVYENATFSISMAILQCKIHLEALGKFSAANSQKRDAFHVLYEGKTLVEDFERVVKCDISRRSEAAAELTLSDSA